MTSLRGSSNREAVAVIRHPSACAVIENPLPATRHGGQFLVASRGVISSCRRTNTRAGHGRRSGHELGEPAQGLGDGCQRELELGAARSAQSQMAEAYANIRPFSASLSRRERPQRSNSGPRLRARAAPARESAYHPKSPRWRSGAYRRNAHRRPELRSVASSGRLRRGVSFSVPMSVSGPGRFHARSLHRCATPSDYSVTFTVPTSPSACLRSTPSLLLRTPEHGVRHILNTRPPSARMTFLISAWSSLLPPKRLVSRVQLAGVGSVLIPTERGHMSAQPGRQFAGRRGPGAVHAPDKKS